MNIKRSLFALSLIYLFFIVYSQYKVYNQAIKFYKKDFSALIGKVQNPTLILNELHEIRYNINENREMKLYIYPEILDPAIGNMNLLIQYAFAPLDYDINNSKNASMILTNNKNHLSVIYNKYKITMPLNYELLFKTTNYDVYGYKN
ncbi:MAG: hypothetical protein MH321_13500 [Leptospiraceae bacterium]|nr:hypothetical protein [Leptospiraceae bacterium]